MKKIRTIQLIVTSMSFLVTGCVQNGEWTAGSHRQLPVRAGERGGGSYHQLQAGGEASSDWQLHSEDVYRTEGQALDDNKLTRDVKGALNASAVFKFPYVRVQTYNGVAQLSGFVMKETQRREAVELARHVPGLKEVINNISIYGTVRPELVTGPIYGPTR